MNGRLTSSALLFLLAAALPAAAQVRDAAPAAAGTGMIAGTVVSDAEPARPVRRAVVTLNSPEPYVGRTSITDDGGRFVFANLPAGRYSLIATKRGWVTAQYGAKAVGRPGRGLSIAAGERASATIKMARGAVITGTILDQFGQPVSDVFLRVSKYGYTFNTGERRLVQTAGSTSGPDERGVYRIYGLAPGEYYISAANRGSPLSTGRDLHLTSEVDVDEAIKAAQGGPAAPMTDVPQPNVGFTQIMYPGVMSVAQATPISLRAGEERAGVDFAIQYSPAARVEGTILGADGTPTAARVNLVLNDPNGGLGGGLESIRTAQAGPDGRFAFAEIAPGPYVMSAHMTQPVAPGERQQIFSAVSDLDVVSDTSGVSLTLQEGFTVSGVVRFDGDGPAPNLSSLRVSLAPAQATGAVTVSTGSMTTAADGRFTLPGISPGRYRLNVNPPSPQTPWVVRSAMLLGQNALDVPVDVRQSVNDATITITDRKSELSGRIDGGSADYTMILFSTDRAHWVPLSRRILSTRTANDGTFTFRIVPPGEYYLAPLDDVEPGEWYDPSFLQRLTQGAITLTIAEGEKKVQNLRVGGG